MRRFAALCACALLCFSPAHNGQAKAMVNAALLPAPEGAAANPEALTPDVAQYVLGWARLSDREAAGQRVEAELSFAPDTVVIPNRGAAQALRALLGAATVRYGRQRDATGAAQTLLLALDGETLLEITHATEGGQALWSSPQLARPIIAPEGLPIWAALFPASQTGVWPTFFDVPLGRGLPTGDALELLLAQAGEAPLTLSAEAVNTLTQTWFAEASGRMGIKTALSWRAVEPLALTLTPDGKGGWRKLRIQAAFALPGEEPWQVDLTFERQLTDTRYAISVDGQCRRDKQDTLQITASWTVTTAKAQLNRDIRLSVRGKTNNYNTELTLRARGSNAYAQQDDVLREQIKESITVKWRMREPNWILAGLGELGLEWSHKGTLTSALGSEAPVAGEGTVSLSFSQGGKVVAAGNIPWRFATGLPVAQSLQAGTPLVIAALGESERSMLEAAGAQLMTQMLPKLFAAWDAKALEALRLGNP